MTTPDNKITVIDLGYVGLTLSTVLAAVGYRVIGIEKMRGEDIKYGVENWRKELSIY